jgi:hypothetical protein
MSVSVLSYFIPPCHPHSSVMNPLIPAPTSPVYSEAAEHREYANLEQQITDLRTHGLLQTHRIYELQSQLHQVNMRLAAEMGQINRNFTEFMSYLNNHNIRLGVLEQNMQVSTQTYCEMKLAFQNLTVATNKLNEIGLVVMQAGVERAIIEQKQQN